MSTTSLPSYVRSSLSRIPSYSAEPQAYEQRLAWTMRVPASRPGPSAEFVKQSKSGGISLRLKDQEQNAPLPVYGCGALVTGTVDLAKTEGVAAVEVKVRAARNIWRRDLRVCVANGRHRLKEASISRRLRKVEQRRINCVFLVFPCGTEIGNRSHARRLFLSACLSLPPSQMARMHMCVVLHKHHVMPIIMLTYSNRRQPLPPTHEVHLSGVPGFRATIDYSVTVYVHKTRSSTLIPIKSRCVHKAHLSYDC